MLTIEALVDELELELAAGAGSADRSIRWIHISELEDPTPWLSGGELLLTTGINLAGAARQRSFLRLLDEHGIAGLGLGTGFSHKRMPKALIDEAETLGFPLFEVPYQMPFIAITERAFTHLVNENYNVLERGLRFHERLEGLVIEERGLDEILSSIGVAVGGRAAVLDARGEPIEATANGDSGFSSLELKAIAEEIATRTRSSRISPFSPKGAGLADSALALPVPGPGSGRAQAWLVVGRGARPLAEFERLIAREAALVVALELMRERVVRETERRLAGDVLAEALAGRLDSEELRRRLRPFGVGEHAAVLVFELDDPAAAEPVLEASLAEAGTGGLVAATAVKGKQLLCAVVDANGTEPIELARRARAALAGEQEPVRAAASRGAPVGSVRRAFHEARCALEATSLGDGNAPEVASHRDLGAFTLLLSLQDDDALRAYAEALLGPIESKEGEYGGELLRSLEAFLEHNGQWERAARQLYCHRHTLRYRIKRVEELTGRDLSRAHDRIELWLALRARELVR